MSLGAKKVIAVQRDSRCLPALAEIADHAALGQRCKILRQSVKSLGGEALLVKASIDPARRAETLSAEEFVRLANCL